MWIGGLSRFHLHRGVLLRQTPTEPRGPLTLEFSLYYASAVSKWPGSYNDLFGGDDFTHNYHLALECPQWDPNLVQVFYAEGDTLQFEKQGNAWQIASQEILYQLKETSGYYYLLDPILKRVCTFQKTTAGYSKTPVGALIRIEDRNGNALTFTNALISNYLLPTRVEDGLGRSLTFTYQDPAPTWTYPHLSKVTDQAGRTIQFEYDVVMGKQMAIHLKSVTDAAGHKTAFSYTGPLNNSYISAQTLPMGNVPYTQTYEAVPMQGPPEDQWFRRVMAQTDAYGNKTQLLFNDPNTTIIDPLGRKSSHTHAYSRLLTHWTDPTGKTVVQKYDAWGRPTAIIDRLGDVTRIAYDPNTGRMNQYTDAEGNTTTLTYEAQPQTFTNAAAKESVTFTFYNLVQATYADGSRVRFAYDPKGNVLTCTDPNGQKSSFTYDGRGQPLTATNPTGGVVTYTYNADATLASVADSDTGVTRYAYDPCKRLQQITRPDGTTVRFTYRGDDRLLSYTDERGKATQLTYDKNGNLTSILDPLKRTTSYAYDLMDRVVRRTDPNGQATQYTYDALGQVKTATNRNGNTATYSYDPRGWLTGVADPGGQTWTTAYDDEGVPSSSTSPTGRTTTFQTDKLGRTTSITDPAGAKTRFVYDKLSRLVSTRDRLDRPTNYTYDLRGLLTGVSLPVVGAAQYTYNALGRLTRIQDAGGAFWDRAYTKMGRLASDTDPLGRQCTYTRDALGRITLVTYPNGDTVALAYDEVGRLTRRTCSDGLVRDYGYNDTGDLISANDLTFTYDVRGDLTNCRYDDGAQFGATYDPGRRLRSVAYDRQMSVTYTYDNRNLLTRVQDDLSGSWIGFAYDDDGRLAEITRSNGVSTSYTYDPAGRLVRIQDSGIADQQYELNAEGEPIRATMTVPYGPATIQYTYDAAGRLTAADYGNGNRLDYTYDTGGNLLKRAGKTPQDSVARTDTFIYDGTSQIRSPGYTEDVHARVTAAPGKTFAYDGASQIRSITAGDDAVSLTYNGLGGLRTRTQGEITTHCYQNYAMGLAPMVAEKQGPDYKRFFVYSPGGALLYGVDATTRKPFFYHFNRVGSTLFLTNAGAVTDGYAHDPYGTLLGHTGDSDQPFTFVGCYGVRWESIGGLYDMRARVYDPATARFLTRDPIWPNTSDPQSLNPYPYAAQNPSRYIDHLGTEPWDPTVPHTQTGLNTYVPSEQSRATEIQRINASLLGGDPIGLEQAAKFLLAEEGYVSTSDWGRFTEAMNTWKQNQSRESPDKFLAGQGQ